MAGEVRASEMFVLRVWHEPSAMRRASVRRADGGEWIDVSTHAALLDDLTTMIEGRAGSPAIAFDTRRAGAPTLRIHVLGAFCALKNDVPPPHGYKAQKPPRVNCR